MRRLLVQEAGEIRGTAVAPGPLAPATVRVVRGLLVQRVVEDQPRLRPGLSRFPRIVVGAHTYRVRRAYRAPGPEPAPAALFRCR
jgi:hypothetical protein